MTENPSPGRNSSRTFCRAVSGVEFEAAARSSCQTNRGPGIEEIHGKTSSHAGDRRVCIEYAKHFTKFDN